MTGFERALRAATYVTSLFAVMFVIFVGLMLTGLFGVHTGGVAHPWLLGVGLVVAGFVSLGSINTSGRPLERPIEKNWRTALLSGAATALAVSVASALTTGEWHVLVSVGSLTLLMAIGLVLLEGMRPITRKPA